LFAANLLKYSLHVLYEIPSFLSSASYYAFSCSLPFFSMFPKIGIEKQIVVKQSFYFFC